MIPVSLRLRNFMSYGEDVPALDFSLISTACLTGDNGHGKSALLDAITWALWGQTRAKSLDDIVRLGQEETEVEFVFDLEDERYRVLRKRSLRTKTGQSALELQGFDRTSQRYRSLSGNTIRETEAKIVQLLHMNYETFVNSVFILQGRADEFTTRRPGERKRILAEILGLTVFDELETRARMHRGEQDQHIKILLQRLEELRSEITRKEEFAAAVRQHETILEQLQSELQDTQQRLLQLQQRQSALLLQRQRAQDVSWRLQQLRQEQHDLTQQIATHRQRLADYEAIVGQEPQITDAYQRLQALRNQDNQLSIQAEEYATLQQRLTVLQQTLATVQHRLEYDQQALAQRLREVDQQHQACEAILREAPRLKQAYQELQEARQRDLALAQALQQRYTFEQEKSQVERRIQQKRHVLELQQRSLLDRRDEWQRRGTALLPLQQRAGELQLQITALDEQATRLEHIRTTGVALKVQQETTLPQQQDMLQKEIAAHQEKRRLLAIGGAHCPLCEKTLTDQERRRVIQKLLQEIAQREQRLDELHQEQQHLNAERQRLRLEYRQVEQQLEKRRAIEQQYAATQASIAEAQQARDQLAIVLKELQELDTHLTVGSYATEELARLRQLTATLDHLSYDYEAHEAVRKTLSHLADIEVQYARFQQATVDITALQQQRLSLSQQLAALEQTLQLRQFALVEQQEIQDITARLAQLDFRPAAYSALRQQLQEQQYIERQYAQLETARTHLTEERATIQGLEAKHLQFLAEMTVLEQEQQRLAPLLHSAEALDIDLKHTEALQHTLHTREGEVRIALGRCQSHYDHCVQREKEFQQQQEYRQRLVEERTLYNDLAQLFGKNGIQAIIIENAIPELENEANRILARITSNAMHLTFETQRDTRAGGIVETLDIKISDTLGTRNYEMFSGGEAFRINFALRIALSKLLAQRAGARLRTLVIDEGFGTQDVEGLERLVEIIKAIQDDFAKIIIITHLRDLKNAFETHIEVKKDLLRGSCYQVM